MVLVAVGAVFAQDGSRETVAILDFATSGDISEAESRVFVDLMSAYIFETGVYRVVDRAQRDTLLDEIEFSVSDVSTEDVLAIGEQLSANKVVVGSLGQIGDRFIVSMRVVDVLSGETINTSSERYDSINDLIDDSEQLALRLMEIDVVLHDVVPRDEVDDDGGDDDRDDQVVPPEPSGRRRGLSLDASLGYAVGFGSNVGATLGLTYQLSNGFSLGAYGGGIMSGGSFVGNYGARAVFGNKVDGVGLALNLGTIPGIGIIARNWILSAGWGGALYLEAGYSLYFGR